MNSVEAACEASPQPPPDILQLADAPTEDGFVDQGSIDSNRPFFDDFSWRVFVALNWPAKVGVRGIPDKDKQFGDRSTGETVWETWKSGPEIVPSDGSQPSPWDSFEFRSPLLKAFSHSAGYAKLLFDINKYEDFSQGGLGSVEAPLIDQRKKYTRYELRVNRTEFEFILNNQYYLREKLDQAAQGGKIEFPVNSIEVKAAWRELPDDPSTLDRFYWRDAIVIDWDSDHNPVLLPRKMGLVGLHIVTKTPQRANWIWSTFEHEDNVVSTVGGLNPPSFNSLPQGMPWGTPGTNERPTGWENAKKGNPLPALKPVEVARKLNFSDFPSTEQTNAAYREHSQIRNTMWRHYRLVRTQWPTQGSGDPTPSNDVANVTMETYRQTITCMECHSTAQKSKFVYFLELRAQPIQPNAISNLRGIFRRLDLEKQNKTSTKGR